MYQSCTPTAFDRAFSRFEDQVPEDDRKFLNLCKASPEATYDEFKQILDSHEQHLDTRTKRVFRVFRRIASALRDYNEVISQFVSVQPLPLALVWGSLKIVVESASRCQKMFETMRGEFDTLQHTLESLADIEQLYPESEKTQDLVVNSYMSILRFWHRVHKECHRSSGSIIKHSLSSESNKKLQDILGQLQSTINDLDRQSRLDEVRRQRTENAKAQEDRDEARLERSLQSKWRERQNAHNYLELCAQVRNHLRPAGVEDVNSSRHERHLEDKLDGTCTWIRDADVYLSWLHHPSPPVLCLTGPAGFGKSVLTSAAIQDISLNYSVAYYFCQRSEPLNSALKLLRLFAFQLFNSYFGREYPVDDKLAHQIIHSHNVEQTQAIIEELVKALHPVVFFIDALDEAEGDSQKHISFVIRFLLAQTVHGAKIWCTQRSHTRSNECSELLLNPSNHALLHIEERTKSDVRSFLRFQFQTLRQRLDEELLEYENKLLINVSEQIAQEKAEGCFLWARLVTQKFSGEKRLTSPQDVLLHIVAYRPDKLWDLYRSMFQQIQENDRKIASKVISLVAFSKRHLRVYELREVINHITRGRKRKLNTELDKLSLNKYISRFSVFVQVDHSKDDIEGNGRCHLIHSSIREFLESNSTVLGEEPMCKISSDVIGRACLSYLHRPVFSRPLRKQILQNNNIDWIDTENQSIETHHFAFYAAKYWARHLEVADSSFWDDDFGQEALRSTTDDQTRNSVIQFLVSDNFATCIQMQTLWVDGYFITYTAGNIRVIPNWLVVTPPSTSKNASKRVGISKFWIDHIFLLHDWQHLLTCFFCRGTDCKFSTFKGEIDRIWWPTLRLGDTFMAKLPSRYYSFTLATESSSAKAKARPFESICVAKDGIKIIRLKSRNHAERSLIFVYEHWRLENEPCRIALVKSQTICTDETSTRKELYTSRCTNSMVVQPVQFSKDATYMRIGKQLFALNDVQEYISLTQPASYGETHPEYLEDFDARSGIIAFGTRLNAKIQDRIGKYAAEERFGEEFTRLETILSGGKRCHTRPLQSESESSDDEAVESWSEGSTEFDVDPGIDSDLSSEAETVSQEAGNDSEESSQDHSKNSHALEDSEVDDSSNEDASINGSDTPSLDFDHELDSGVSSNLEVVEGNQEVESEEWSDHDAKNLRTPEDSEDNGSSDDEASVSGSETSGYSNFSQSSAIPSRSPSPIFNLYSDDSDDEEAEWARRVDMHLSSMQSRKKKRRESGQGDVTFTVLDHRKHPPVELFKYKRPLSSMLYRSPPAIHPTASLVVYPLDLGDLLFVDFAENTFFIRRIRPSASGARQISVQPHFSFCGGFLHIASIEARPPDTSKESSVTLDVPRLPFSVLILTYRLSCRKTSRALPLLIHRVKLDAGMHEFEDTDVLGLPVTFTWTNTDVFVTQRAAQLTVSKVSLFPRSDHPDVLVPKEPVFLPMSTMERDVYFFPGSDDQPALTFLSSEYFPRLEASQDAMEVQVEVDGKVSKAFKLFLGDNSRAKKVMLRGMLAPPIGCALQTKDLGGWVRSKDLCIPMGHGVGKLDQRREKFDSVDDCTVETFGL